jgi:hypothetical protein
MIGRSVCFFPLFWNKAPRGADVVVRFLWAEARRAKKIRLRRSRILRGR